MLKIDQKNDTGCIGEENARLIKELVDVSRQLGEQSKENEMLREQIEKLKADEQDKSPRHTIHSGSNIAAEPEVKYK